MKGFRSVSAASRFALKSLLASAVVGLAAFLLYRTLRGHSLEELAAQIRSADAGRVSAAFGFAAGSYGCLTLFDFLAVRYAGRPLRYPKVALASFVSLSLGHNLGFAALSSGAVRFRFYSRWGLSTGEVAKVILFCGLTVGLGLAALAALALVLRQDIAMRLTGLSASAVIMVAAGIAALLATYPVLCATLRHELRIRSWGLRLPPPQLALAQLLIGPINFALVAACLHQSLATVSEASYLDVAAAYVIANVATLISHVPGGLGVVETVVTMTLQSSDILGGLIIFRLVYFLVPLALGSSLLLASELLIGRASAKEAFTPDAAEREGETA